MRHFSLPATLLLLIAASMNILGCGFTEYLSFSSSPPVRTEPVGLTPVISTVKLGSISGPPKPTADRMVRMLDAAADKAKIALLNYDGAQGDYLLRGDLKATRIRGKIRVTYNWYVLDRQGNEVGRKLGTEQVDGAAEGSDPWSEIPEDKLQIIAEAGIAAVISRG
ncbi:MAG: hypothetical protein ACLP7P_05030 [Rhodomicrobium sp.]